MSAGINGPTREMGAADLVSALLSSPDSLSKIGDIISRATGGSESVHSPPNEDDSSNNSSQGDTNEQKGENSDDSSPTFQSGESKDIPSSLGVLRSLLGGGSDTVESKRQRDLLLAIKPYLSPRRRELIELFVKLGGLGEIMKKLN